MIFEAIGNTGFMTGSLNLRLLERVCILGSMKPLTTSVYTFSDLIAGGYLYVDKTAAIYELIRAYKGQYFLSRPRRFGKSLLISTLKVIFEGRRDLFEGLALTGKDYDWQRYPVIHLDMGIMASADADELRGNLLRSLRRAAKDNDCEIKADVAYQAFEDLIRTLADRDGKVVILIDEYDKPLLGHLGQESAREIQAVLKQFYAVVKTTEPQQRFVLITGVSKFSKVSIFSDLNNLTDLTMSGHAATLLGYTQEEVEANFPDYIERLAEHLHLSVERTLDELRVWYNGYKFHQDAATVYNPVSLMKCFDNQEFKNYWFETGTPTFLLELLKRKPLDLVDLNAPEDSFSVYEADKLHALPLLYQTGYLTIRNATQTGRRRQYHLGFPNFEIEESLSLAVSSSFANLELQEANSALCNMVKALQTGDVDTMLEHLKTFFHKVQYDLIEMQQKEKYYQTIFFTVFKLVGAMIDAEVKTSRGRIDAVIKTADHIYIFEFKLNGTAEQALQQIRDKQYAAGYRDDPRKKVLVGVAFSAETRNLGQWVVDSVSAGSTSLSAKCHESTATYGSTEEKGFEPADEFGGLLRAVRLYADAVRESEQVDLRKQEIEQQIIKDWAPFIRKTWQNWKPNTGEVIVMLYLCGTPPVALRQIVKSCTERKLRTTEWEGQPVTYNTELDADPAANEQAVFPLPKAVYDRLVPYLDMQWVDRTPVKAHRNNH